MLDMGFIPDIRKILSLLPVNRQIMLFSATMPAELEAIARQILVNPFKIEVTPQGSTSHEIDQKVHIIDNVPRRDSFMKKSIHLNLAIAEAFDLKNSIIFCNRKKDVDSLARFLASKGLENAALHGNLTQTVRNKVLDNFSTGKTKHLIASDVASRGLDIPEVSHVFNFDLPINLEDYVHRIGRTGRAGKRGKAVTICFEHERPIVTKIENLIKKTLDKESFSQKGKLTDEPVIAKSLNEKNSKRFSRDEKSTGQILEKPWNKMDVHIPDFLLKPTTYPKN